MDNESIQLWFGLSRASFAVLPRVLIEAMPHDWQQRLAGLLEEADDAFPSAPDFDYCVQQRVNGRIIDLPDFMRNYRRPDASFIAACRRSHDAKESNARDQTAGASDARQAP